MPVVITERRSGKFNRDVTNNELGGLKWHGDRTGFLFWFHVPELTNKTTYIIYTVCTFRLTLLGRINKGQHGNGTEKKEMCTICF
jgi:hypothetical protein